MCFVCRLSGVACFALGPFGSFPPVPPLPMCPPPFDPQQLFHGPWSTGQLHSSHRQLTYTGSRLWARVTSGTYIDNAQHWHACEAFRMGHPCAAVFASFMPVTCGGLYCLGMVPIAIWDPNGAEYPTCFAMGCHISSLFFLCLAPGGLPIQDPAPEVLTHWPCHPHWLGQRHVGDGPAWVPDAYVRRGRPHPHPSPRHLPQGPYCCTGAFGREWLTQPGSAAAAATSPTGEFLCFPLEVLPLAPCPW